MERISQARAIQRNIHISSRKAKLVCDLIRNKPVQEALSILEHTNKKAATYLKKLLDQAISNAVNNHALKADKLYIFKVVANQGPTLKRTMPRAKGSADLIRKRYSHLEIIVSDDPNEKQKELQKIKDRIKKRALNNKGYSAKQRKANEQKLKNAETKKTKKVVNKKDASKKAEAKKTVVKKSVSVKKGK